MGRIFEVKLEPIFEKGYRGLREFLDVEGSYGRKILFNWLCLIFIKTHLKDGTLLYDRDKSSGDERMISHMHNVGSLHHIHCLARSFYTGAEWDQLVFGSLDIFETKVRTDLYESFDFADLHQSFSIMLRLGDVGVIAVLNDGGLSRKSVDSYLKIIDGPLSPVQLSEIMARMSHFSTVLLSRPEYQSRISGGGDHKIVGKWPDQVELREQKAEHLGEVLWMLCKKYLEGLSNEDEVRDSVLSGHSSFLVRDGEFDGGSMDTVSDET